MEKRWIYPAKDRCLQNNLSDKLNISPLLAQILVNRGHTGLEDARDFLKPEINNLEDPMALQGMEKAATRIYDAVCKGEKIVIYGDYDVDGITGTALMFRCLDVVYGNVSYYIPERLKEGYGLNEEAVNRFVRDGVNLIITVDCGINSCHEADVAKRHGIDLIITDHHEPGDDVPDAFAVINPRLESATHRLIVLSGVGLAFKLAWAVAQTFSPGKRVSHEFRDFLIGSTGLAALGTITDVVPLHGENRIITSFGLKAIQDSRYPGLSALIKMADLESAVLQTNHVGFRIGPRLNACGRIGKAAIAVELLTTKSEKRALEIVMFIDSENKKRQDMQKVILESAKEKIANDIDLRNQPAIILSDESWHPGVVGIIASKLAEEYFRPAIMFGYINGLAHGSARSIPSFHILNALETCRGMLISLGGHSQAAGLKIHTENIETFKASFNKAASEILHDNDLTPTLEIDAEVPLSTLSKALVKEFDKLAPYGAGNPPPCLSSTKLQIAGKPKRVGRKGQHLSFFVRQGDVSYKAIAFGGGDKLESLRENDGHCSLAYTPKINKWMNNESLELDVKDMKICP